MCLIESEDDVCEDLVVCDAVYSFFIVGDVDSTAQISRCGAGVASCVCCELKKGCFLLGCRISCPDDGVALS